MLPGLWCCDLFIFTAQTVEVEFSAINGLDAKSAVIILSEVCSPLQEMKRCRCPSTDAGTSCVIAT